MAAERALEIICEHCGKPCPNNLKKGPPRRFHPHCADERRKANQRERRRDPAVRKREQERARERRQEVQRNPKLREVLLEDAKGRRRTQREKAKLFDQLGPEMKRIWLRLDRMESVQDDELARLRRRIRQLEEHTDLPGHKATPVIKPSGL